MDRLLSRRALVALEDPFQGGDFFETRLDWIGDTMQPEISPNYLAYACKREEMYPTAGELVIGLLNSGHLVFGAHEYESPGLCRISFINPSYAPAYYPDRQFRWLCPVAGVSLLSETTPRYKKLTKTIEFFSGDY